MTFKIRNTQLVDDTIRQFTPDSNNLSGRSPNLDSDTYNVWIICAILIFAFNVVATVIALITIGTKGYDPYIHGLSMLISVFTLGCIAAIHKFIIKD